MKKYKSYTMIKYTKKEFQKKVLKKSSVYFTSSLLIPFLFVPVTTWQTAVVLFLLILIPISALFLQDAIDYFRYSRQFDTIEQPTWELLNKIVREAHRDDNYAIFIEIGGKKYGKYDIAPSFSCVEWKLLEHGFSLADKRISQERLDQRIKEVKDVRQHFTSELCNKEEQWKII